MATEGQCSFLDELNEELSRHSGVNHPLLSRLAELNEEELRQFASQFYLYVRVFPRLLGAVIYRVRDEGLRQALVLNLVNECGGLVSLEAGDLSETHPALYRRFTGALGISDDELDRTKPLPSTNQFINTYRKLYLRSHLTKVLGAVGPGTECIVPAMYSLILDGLERRGQFSGEHLKFFHLHLPLDAEHCEMICAAVRPLINGNSARDMVRAGAYEALEARKRFWDGLAQQFQLQSDISKGRLAACS
jgi:pyrroloquinoline-quinone synthase